MHLDGIGPCCYGVALPDLGPFAAFRLAVELHQPLHHQALGFPAATHHIDHLEQLDQGNMVLIGLQGKFKDNGLHGSAGCYGSGELENQGFFEGLTGFDHTRGETTLVGGVGEELGLQAESLAAAVGLAFKTGVLTAKEVA